LSQGRAGSVRGGDRLPWVKVDSNAADKDNFAALQSLDWQVHVYGDITPQLKEVCDQRKLPLHVFSWNPEMARAGLQRHAIYLVRPDGYIALADPSASASSIETYLDKRRLGSRR
jgi:hypothetical protein